MIQDYVYLVYYVWVWVLGVVKVELFEEMWLCVVIVDLLINYEFFLYIEMCVVQGIDEQIVFNVKEDLEMIVYICYVLDFGLQGDFFDLILVFVFCVFGYGEIGLLLKDVNYVGYFYEKWIVIYSGDKFQDVCVKVGYFVDFVIECCVGNELISLLCWLVMQVCFIKVVELELVFWGMGLKVVKQICIGCCLWIESI